MAKTYAYNDFPTLIDDAGGIFLTDMEALRDAHGVGKLGVHIRAGIKSQLESRGIGTLPDELPNYQHEEVRLYRLGSPIANVISAVVFPSEAGDATLRQTAGSNAQDLLRRVREIVCE
jgi:hypothetical protein